VKIVNVTRIKRKEGAAHKNLEIEVSLLIPQFKIHWLIHPSQPTKEQTNKNQ